MCRAILDDLTERAKETLVEFERGPGSAKERLQQMIRSRFEYARENPHRMTFGVEFFAGPDSSGIKSDFLNKVRIFTSTTETILRQGMEDGSFRNDMDVSIMTNIITGTLDQYCFIHAQTGNPELNDELADLLVLSLYEGLGPR